MRRNRHHALLHACLLAAAACALPAAAQTLGEARSRTAYAADYFEDIAPANAHDMVLRVPGFTIVESDADVRGYAGATGNVRSEEHTSELQSLMRISYAVFCLKKKKKKQTQRPKQSG